jgi:iron complex outermembrane receptor protein
MILNIGIRLEGRQWGAEHAPEIVPFLADEITQKPIKVQKLVRYGPEAMGGVILVILRHCKKQSLTEISLRNTNGQMGNTCVSHGRGSE